MEHAHHFLTRLDRLSIPHVELALSLYRDHELMKYILDSAKVPEGVERIALSLADPNRGPFLVVTRSGKFVTCLGEGMRKGALPVITREKLDGIATRVEVLRGRMEVARKVTGERGGVGKLFRRLHDAGPRLSREEFTAAAAWQPMLITDFIRWMIDTADDVKKARVILLRQLRRSDKLNPKFEDAARSYYNSVWFIGHMAALGALDGRLAFEDWPEKALQEMHKMPYAWSAVRQGMIGPALRGIWGAGRMGEMLLQTYKRLHGEATTLFRVVEATFSLAAIGLRHSRLAAEAEKTLISPLPRSVGGEMYQKILDHIAKEVSLTFRVTREEPDFMDPVHLKVGGKLAVQLAACAKPGSRFKFTNEDDVLVDLAYALPCNIAHEFAGEWKNFQLMTVVLPWLATAEAEQLYLPAEYLSEVQYAYEIDDVMPLLRAFRDIEAHAPGPTRSTPKGSARNAPCPCGSGVKYKRCCALKTAAVEKDEDDDEEPCAALAAESPKETMDGA